MIEINTAMKEAHAQRLALVESYVDNQIKRAVAQGEHTCYFACDKDIYPDVYNEIRAKYERAGYIIVPTGRIGGVYQRTEDICW